MALLLFALFWQSSVHAEIYKYQDDNGEWYFTDEKPKKKSQTFERLSAENGKSTKQKMP